MNEHEEQLLWKLERNLLRTTIFLQSRAIERLLENMNAENRKFANEVLTAAEEVTS